MTKKQSFSNQELLEVFTAKINELALLTAKVKDIAPAVASKLEEFKNHEIRVNVDTSGVNRINVEHQKMMMKFLDEMDQIEKRMAKKRTNPTWLTAILVVLALWSALSAYYVFDTWSIVNSPIQNTEIVE